MKKTDPAGLTYRATAPILISTAYRVRGAGKGQDLSEAVANMGWGVLFIVVGGVAGIAVLLLAAAFIPRLMERLTPAIDEEKEIARGNAAVAEYFGRVVGACILGASVIIAAAVLGGILAALH